MQSVDAGPSTFHDPIEFEVGKNALREIADTMGLVMIRSARSANANSTQDFSTAICDGEGRVLAQGNTLLVHLGTISDAVKQIVEQFNGRIDEGDLFIFNETPKVSQHLPDVYVIRPCFFGGVRIGFAACCAHHVDIGGRVGGGVAADSREIYEEGLQLPLAKLARRGEVDETLKAIICQNVRVPELVWGDLEGQMATCYMGERGLASLVRRYSVEWLQNLGAELFDYTERLTRMEIAAIPDGTYSFEDWLDDDGVGNGPVRLHVAITVRGDSIDVDWTGSAPQLPSALNCPMTNTRSMTYGALQGAFSDEIPSNDGFYRPIRISAPKRAVVNPEYPAAHAARGITTGRMLDTLLGALAQALPGRIPAAGEGGQHSVKLAGIDDKGQPIIAPGHSALESWGGRPGIDGIDGISPFQANLATNGVEDVEASWPILIEERALRPDSGGAGRWRGGLGHIDRTRFLGKEGVAVLRWGRRDFVPYGLAGGKPAVQTRVVLNPGTDREEALPLNGQVRVVRGDVIMVANPGGGGYGDPWLRDPDAVLEDVLEQKLSAEYARREYGVVIDAAAGKVVAVERDEGSRIGGGAS